MSASSNQPATVRAFTGGLSITTSAMPRSSTVLVIATAASTDLTRRRSRPVQTRADAARRAVASSDRRDAVAPRRRRLTPSEVDARPAAGAADSAGLATTIVAPATPAPSGDPLDFTGQVVLVTGGTRNIGRAISDRFAAAGATVVAVRAQRARRPRRRSQFVACDVRDARRRRRHGRRGRRASTAASTSSSTTPAARRRRPPPTRRRASPSASSPSTCWRRCTSSRPPTR